MRNLTPKLDPLSGIENGASPSSALVRHFGGGLKPLPPQVRVPINHIETDPDQPRQHFDPQRLDELAESIRKHGIDQPLIVRTIGEDRYQLIAGERRLRASRQAGHVVVPVLIRDDLSNSDAELLRLRENLQRENLTPVETAHGLKRYKEITQKTWDAVGEDFGWNRRTVLDHVRILEAPESVQLLIESNRIPPSHYTQVLASLPENQQITLARRAAEEGWTKAELRQARENLPARSSGEEPSGTNRLIGESSEDQNISRSTSGPASKLIPDAGPEVPLGPSTKETKADESVSGYTPGFLQASAGIARQRKVGQYGAEIRIPVTPELQRRLRHHAADHSGGSITALSRSALEWITGELDAGRIPWEPSAPDPAE